MMKNILSAILMPLRRIGAETRRFEIHAVLLAIKNILQNLGKEQCTHGI